MDTPPGLNKLQPPKKAKDQQTAAELLASTWDVIPEGVQSKLQALGFGPSQPEDPELTDLLKTHMSALPQAVQDVVNRLTQPIRTRRRRLRKCSKTQVTDLKTISIRKTQLQTKLDQDAAIRRNAPGAKFCLQPEPMCLAHG